MLDTFFNRHTISLTALALVEQSHGKMAVGIGGKVPNLVKSASIEGIVELSFSSQSSETSHNFQRCEGVFIAFALC